MTTPTTPAQAEPVAIPEGWDIAAKMDGIAVSKPGLGWYFASAGSDNIASTILHELASDLLAAPTPQAVPEPTADLGLMAALQDILDGLDTGEGVAPEPWQSLRVRVLALVRPTAAARDAARYRWLRDGWWLDPESEKTPDPMTFANTPEQFDTAIDAAMAATAQPGDPQS